MSERVVVAVMSCEKIRYERTEFTDENKVSCSVSDQEEEQECVRTYHVTSRKEKVKLTQKYSVLSAVDPVSGETYDLAAIVQRRLIDLATTDFRVPSTGQLVPLDEAIERGMVLVELFDEFVEKTNECYEYTEENRTVYSLSADPLTTELGLDNSRSSGLKQITLPKDENESDEEEEDEEVKECLERFKFEQLGHLFITEV